MPDCPDIPVCPPDVIDVCGETGFQMTMIPSSTDKLVTKITCGEVDGEVITYGAFFEGYHVDSEGVISSAPIISSKPDLQELPEPGFGVIFLLVAILVTVVLRNK